MRTAHAIDESIRDSLAEHLEYEQVNGKTQAVDQAVTTLVATVSYLDMTIGRRRTVRILAQMQSNIGKSPR